MHVLFLHKYSGKAAGFRYRLKQYLPHLEKAGITYDVSSLFDDEYLSIKYESGRANIPSVIRAFSRRMRALSTAHRYDLVVVYGEILPYMPAVCADYLVRAGIPYVYDYDDALFHNYDMSPKFLVRALLKNKIRRVIAGSSGVFAGNQYLADYASKVNHNVVIMPTVVSLDRYSQVKDFSVPSTRPFTVGWIGSPSTAPYLEEILPAMRQFSQGRQTRLLAVGSGKINLEGIPHEIRAWREDHELADILEFDVGVMPLPDTPWSRGKCGFKLIQYMACGLPVIASPVGVNSEIVSEGVNGFFATSTQDWVSALTRMYDDRSLLPTMGSAGRSTVENRYSLAATAEPFIAGLHRALKRRPGGDSSPCP